jgi:predicted Zn-dependent protease
MFVHHRACAVVVLAAFTFAGCAVNPATGKRQLSLVGEGQEVEMGRSAAEQVRTSLGLYTDDALHSYLDGVGQRVAAASERPQLTWSFAVVDDAAVNAFALPGGFIYVTRGLLTHLNSEAELAAVLGHEIGHVAARHSVNQMSKAQLASIGLGLGMILRPELQGLGQVGQAGLGLLLLKYGRDDENQADELGLRYMTKAGYPATGMPTVLHMLERVSESENAGRVPNWLSTHPSPENRVTRVNARIRDLRDAGSGNIRRETYLRHADGLVYGANPREGFVRENVFYHPEMAFKIEFPKGFEVSNQKQMVGAISSNHDAVLVVALSGRASPEAAAREFFAQAGVQEGRRSGREINGLDADTREFAAAAGDVPVRGLATFVAHGGHVFEILGYSASNAWSRYDGAFEDSMRSFGRLTDRRYLDVEPLRVKVVPMSRLTSFDELSRRAPVSRETLLLLNGVESADDLREAAFVKTVVGDDRAAEILRDQERQKNRAREH